MKKLKKVVSIISIKRKKTEREREIDRESDKEK